MPVTFHISDNPPGDENPEVAPTDHPDHQSYQIESQNPVFLAKTTTITVKMTIKFKVVQPYMNKVFHIVCKIKKPRR